MLALSRRSRRVILSASTVAALGATTLVWGRTARGRVESAERDLVGSESGRLRRRDAAAALRAESRRRMRADSPTGAPRDYVTSDIAAAGNPIDPLGVADRYRTGRRFQDGGHSDSAPRHRARRGDGASNGERDHRAGADRHGGRAGDGGAVDRRRRDGCGARAEEPPLRAESVRALLGLSPEHDVEPPYTVRLRGPRCRVPDTTAGPRLAARGQRAARRSDRSDGQA